MFKKSKKMFPIGTLILSIILVISMLVGCGKQNQKKTTNSQSSTTSSSADKEKKPEKEEPVVIEYLAYDTHGEPDPESPIVKAVEERVNAKFKFWFIDNQKFEEVLNVKLSSGEMPDVLKLTEKTRANVAKYVKMGVLAEVPEEKIREYAPNYSAYIDEADPTGNIWEVMKHNGKNYGWTISNKDGSYPTLLVWRNDWLKNIGYDKMPETLEEFEDVMYKFRNNDPDQNGKKDTYGLSNKAFTAIFGAFGVKGEGLFDFKNGFQAPIIKKDGQVVYQAIQPEVKDALAVLQKWYKDGVIDPEFITGENTGGYVHLSHALMNNRIGVTGSVMFYHYSPPDEVLGTKGGNCYRETVKVNPEAELAFGKPPIGPDGKMGTHAWGVVNASFAMTTKAVKDERKVKTILSLWDIPYVDEEYAKMTQWGIEGKDFEIIDGNVKILGEGGTPAEVRKYGRMVFPTSTIALTKFRKNRYEFAEKVSNFNGYPRVVLPVPEEAGKVEGTLARLTQEAFVKIITGEKDIDYFDQFVEEFNKAGGAEAQKAYNEMLK